MCKKRSVLFSLLILLLIPLAYAEPSLILSPSSFQVNGNTGDVHTFYMDFFNNGTVPISSVSFTPLDSYVFPSIPSLGVNQHINLSVTAQINNPTTATVISIASFYYIENSTTNPMNYTISIGNSSYNPSQITIRQGDRVIWTNNDVLNHTVTALDNSFFFEIAPGQSIDRIFNNIGSYVFYDNIFNGAGQIIVNSNQVENLVHNSVYDRVVTFFQNIVTGSNTTTITLIDNNISMRYDEELESALIIQNNGNYELFNVVLSDSLSWLNFTQNMINISAFGNKVVVFEVNPIINNTSQTNKSYTTSVSAVSFNGNPVNANLNIFIEYSEINQSINNASLEYLLEIFDIGTLEELLRILRGFENQSNGTQYIILPVNDTLELQVSKEKFNKLLDEFEDLKGQSERIFNEKTTNDESIRQIGLNMSEIRVSLDSLFDDSDANREMIIFTFIILGFAILGFGGSFIFKKFLKKNDPLISPQEDKDAFGNS